MAGPITMNQDDGYSSSQLAANYPLMSDHINPTKDPELEGSQE